jgi:hypothetical protein
MNSINKPIYKLRFFFDYNCGGCLWAGNKAAYDKFDVGCLDSETIDLTGAISSKAKIILPPAIRNKVIDLDNRYAQSLNWNDPGGESLWDKSTWERFYLETKALHKEISLNLGNLFEVVYEMEK